MKLRMSLLPGCFALCAGTMIGIGPAWAEDVAAFYKGKRITLIIGYSAGGGYGTYARAIGRHITKHIPGTPAILPKNMAGAGSRRAANYLYSVAPRDGTYIGTIGQGVPLDQTMKKPGVKYDASKFSWIGNSILDNNITYISSSTGLKTIQDAKLKGGVICGGTGATSPSVAFPQIINNLIGTKFQIIRGYPGGSEINLAQARGEVNCRGSKGWASTKATLTQELKNRDYNIIMQWGPKRNPEISQYMGWDVPLITEFAKTDLDRKALAMITSGVTIGRPLMTPPDVPPERVAALRAAFDATMKDPAFLALAKKQHMDINPMPGAELQKVVSEVINAPPDAVARLHELLAPRDVTKLKAKSLAGSIQGVSKRSMTVMDQSGKSMNLRIHPRRTKVKIAGKKRKTKNLKVKLSCTFKYLPGAGNLVTAANCK